jgi:antitoxin VapB
MSILVNKRENMKTVKIFKSGNSKAVRIPKEYHINAEELIINKVGNTLILFPRDDPWELFKKSLSEFSKDVFSDGRKQPIMQKRRTD